jgi:hypothetical protein
VQKDGTVISGTVNCKNLKLSDTASTYSVSLVAPALSANNTFTFPASNGSNGNVLTTNGAGVTSWAVSGMTDPMTSIGDMVVRNTSNVTSRLGIGNGYTTLRAQYPSTSSAAIIPTWGRTIDPRMESTLFDDFESNIASSNGTKVSGGYWLESFTGGSISSFTSSLTNACPVNGLVTLVPSTNANGTACLSQNLSGFRFGYGIIEFEVALRINANVTSAGSTILLGYNDNTANNLGTANYFYFKLLSGSPPTLVLTAVTPGASATTGNITFTAAIANGDFLRLQTIYDPNSNPTISYTARKYATGGATESLSGTLVFTPSGQGVFGPALKVYRTSGSGTSIDVDYWYSHVVFPNGSSR